MWEIDKPFHAAIELSEDYEEYSIDATVTWSIENLDIKNNKCWIRANLTQEDNEATEVYINNKWCANYLLKTVETFDLWISAKDIEKALNADDAIRVKIKRCDYIAGKILEATYESGKKLTEHELYKNCLGKFDYTNETIMLNVIKL